MAEVTKKEKYYEAVGRRKTSVARARMWPIDGKKSTVTVNERPIEEYFLTNEQRDIVFSALNAAGVETRFKVSAKVSGGGTHSQAEALRHAIARAIVVHDGSLRKTLKAAKLLTRDPRAKERRKFGLKKARKAPQWSKR
ncbi:MAG: 30S ribosomal protein S9 [Candidatus Paceibacterota bacterium]|jgi:small subunit ribosomal protein S9